MALINSGLIDANTGTWKSRPLFLSLSQASLLTGIRVKKWLAGIIDAAVHEQTHAGNSAIFEILRAAHPDASDASLKAALQTAADFEGACVRSFKYASRILSQDADHAVAAARAEYPQFQEETYQLASFRLATAMR
jgi:hypothetical protein